VDVATFGDNGATFSGVAKNNGAICSAELLYIVFVNHKQHTLTFS
jgi:hypothetical protein